MPKEKVTDVVRGALEPFLAENGYALFNIEYVKEGKDWMLRVYIDIKDEPEGKYVSIEDCEKVSRYLSSRLDEVDPIEKNYFLEVSSPGIDRPLTKDSDYDKYKGKMIDISLYKALDKRKELTGELVGLVGGQIVIKDAKGRETEIPRENAAKVRLAVIV